MGMDINGRSPSTEEGDYFRASIWSWPPILALAKTAIEVYSLGFSTQGWDYNDGMGLETQEECSRLADAMQSLLDSAESPVLTAQHSEMARSFVSAFGSIDGVKPQAEVNKSHAQEFITFLRGCGGFAIW